MRIDRILALFLVVLCLVASVGNWLSNAKPGSSSAPSGMSATGSTDVALINVYGLIGDTAPSSPFSGSAGASSTALIRAVRRAREDNVKAILLRINSPGGTASAAQAVYEELMRTRKETRIKIVASLGDVAASGGYYIASAAHHIVANPASLTGSIGVIVRTQNLSSLLDKVGVEVGTVQSGQYKDILSPYRQTTPEERKLLEGIVTESYQQFLGAIAAGREMSLEKVKPWADGRVFTGTQAQKIELVDSLGNYTDAVDKTAEIAKIKGKPKVRKYTGSGWPGSLDQLFSSSLEQFIPGVQQARIAQWHKIPLTLME